MIGPFDVEFIPVTHSVPHAFAIALHTPQGVIFHTGDWKLDLTPVDGRTTDIARIGAIASGDGIRLMLGDSTNAEEAGHTVSETAIGEVLRDQFRNNPDKRVIVTCFASHIHRIQQVMDAAVAQRSHRGHARSVDGQERRAGAQHGSARRAPTTSIVDIDDIGDLPARTSCA